MGAADHRAFLEAVGLTTQRSMYDNIVASRANLDLWQKLVPGLNVHFFFSLGRKTEFSYTYTGAFGRDYSKPPTDINYSDGDGTVCEDSLTAFQHWPVDATTNTSVHRY